MNLKKIEIKDIEMTQKEAIEVLFYNTDDEYEMFKEVANRIDDGCWSKTVYVSIIAEEHLESSAECEENIYEIDEMIKKLNSLKEIARNKIIDFKETT